MNQKERTGFSSAFAEGEFSVKDAVGGVRGIIESLAPTLIFLVLFVATRSAVIASVAAVVVVAILVAARVFQRQPLGPAIGGAFIVAVGAVVAIRSGSGAGFYLPGLLINAAWAVFLLVSVAVRLPVVGFVAAVLDERVRKWREHPRARSLYIRATALYALLFAAKVAVQAPLYFMGLTDALGVAKLVMGLPLFAAVTYVIYLMHRGVVAVLDSHPVTGADAPEPNSRP